MTDRNSAHAPFDRWPEHRRCEGALFWRFAPGVLVSQSRGSVATLPIVKNLTQVVDLVLKHDRGDSPEAPGIVLFHDWRSFESYDSAARKYLLDRMRTRPRGYVRRTLVVVPPTPLWRMALAGANLIYSFLSVAAPEIYTDIHKALTSAELAGLPSPAPNWFRA